MNSKRGAMELSMSTIVIVVLSMALLVGGLLLVRNVTGGATQSVDTINEKVMSEINGLFSENKRVVVKLGSNRLAKIKADDEVFGVVVAASTIDGDLANSENIKYKLSLDESARENCLTEIGQVKTEELFLQTINEEHGFDSFDGSTAAALIQLQIPEGTKLCTQKVFFDVYEDGENNGREFFVISIRSKGLF
ncbi:hypothetical protein HN747_03430 [archaeon]|jgi:hypothetical protein|nr:hypothetical protein [archaeon]